MEIRPYVGATLAANRAHKPRLDVRQPDVIGPGITADRKRVAAAVVTAIDEDSAQAGSAHCGEGDLVRAIGPADDSADRAASEAARTVSGPTGLPPHRRSRPLGCQQSLRRPDQLTSGGRPNRSVWSGFRPGTCEGAWQPLHWRHNSIGDCRNSSLSPIVRQVEPPPRLLFIASKHAQIALGTFLAARYSSPAPPSENACAPLRRGGAMPPS